MPTVKSLLSDDRFALYRKGIVGLGTLSAIYVVLIAFLVYQLDSAKGVLADVYVFALWTFVIQYATCLVFGTLSLSDLIPKAIAILTVTAPALILLGIAFSISDSVDDKRATQALLSLLILIVVTSTIAALIRQAINQRVLAIAELPNAQNWEASAYLVSIAIAILFALVMPEKHAAVYFLMGIGLSLPGILIMHSMQWSSEWAGWMKIFLTLVFLFVTFLILQQASDIRSAIIRFPIHVMCYLGVGVAHWFLSDLPLRWLDHYEWRWMACSQQNKKELEGILFDQNN